MHLSFLHTRRLKCHGLHSQVRMYFGSFWVETNWKETLPRRQHSEPPTAKTYKRTECVFVQVFCIGPVPDIFLNKTKWQTIFGITTFFLSEGSSQIPGSSDACLTSQEFIRRHYRSTPVSLHYIPTKANFSCLDVIHVNIHAQSINQSWTCMTPPVMTFLLQPMKRQQLDHPLPGLFEISTSNWL